MQTTRTHDPHYWLGPSAGSQFSQVHKLQGPALQGPAPRLSDPRLVHLRRRKWNC